MSRQNIRAVWPGAKAEEPTTDEKPTVEEVLQAFAIGMPTTGVRLCRIEEQTAATAQLLAKALFTTRESCRKTFQHYPLSLTNAAAVDAAKDPNGWWDLRFEASALASLLETGACKKTTDVQLALRAMEKELPLETVKENFRLRRLTAARELHAEICARSGVRRRSRMSTAEVAEGLALQGGYL